MKETTLKNPIAVLSNIMGSLCATEYDIADAANETERFRADGRIRLTAEQKEKMHQRIERIEAHLEIVKRLAK